MRMIIGWRVSRTRMDKPAWTSEGDSHFVTSLRRSVRVLAVRDLLTDPSLGLRLLTAGGDDREIRWAHACELADPTEFVEGGVLLLLTGVGLPGDGAGQATYVSRVAAAGVAALGFGIGLSHRSVPAALVDAADRRGLPLLEVPRPTPFMAITRAVARSLARQEMAEKEFVLGAQRRLTAAAVGRGAPAAVLDEVVRLVDGWALLLGRTGTVLAAAPADADRHRNALTADLARLRSAPGSASFATHHGGAETWVQSLTVDADLVGFLAVGRATALSGTERQVVNAAVPLLVLALDRCRLVGLGLERLRAGVLRLLLAGQASVVAQTAAELWNGLPEPPVVLVTCRGTRFAVGAATDRLLADREVAARRVLHARIDDELACLPAAAEIDVVLEAVRPVSGLRVGVSDPTGLDELEQARGEAAQAADAAGGGRAGGASVVRFRDIPHSDLLDLLSHAAAAEFSDRLLAPLRLDPAAGRVDMLRSLTVWLAHHGQWEPAAAELGVHRHTLRNRVQRAESLLGRRLDSPDLRAELWMALRLADQPAAASGLPRPVC
jgi:PucR family transcriptional regulator, purine catabolism regulatory protein